MAENLHSPEVYDFRRYDRVWQRVAPDLEPYPGVSTAAAMPAPPPQAASAASMARQESQLPGAAQDPCCMGSAASEMLEVLTGYIVGCPTHSLKEP